MTEATTGFRPKQRTAAAIFSSLAVRALVAVIGIPLMIGAANSGGYWLLAVVSILAMLGLWEFYGMVQAKGYRALTWWGLALGLALIIAIHVGAPLPWGIAVGILLTMFCAHVIVARRDHPVIALSTTVFGVVYVPLLLAHMMLLRNCSELLGAKLLILTFVLVWIDDTGAYFTGMSLGRHPLAQAISPKKSVEGLIGGTLLTAACAIGIKYWLIPELRSWEMLAIALGIAALGVLGDLFESMLKRDSGIKDSGTILPGHGGILDRFDSLLFAVPFVYWFARLILFR